jgi:hypothetical protein
MQQSAELVLRMSRFSAVQIRGWLKTNSIGGDGGNPITVRSSKAGAQAQPESGFVRIVPT